MLLLLLILLLIIIIIIIIIITKLKEYFRNIIGHPQESGFTQNRNVFQYYATYTVFIISIEWFSFECRIVIGFAFTTPPDWFKKLAPFFSSNQK